MNNTENDQIKALTDTYKMQYAQGLGQNPFFMEYLQSEFALIHKKLDELLSRGSR